MTNLSLTNCISHMVSVEDDWRGFLLNRRATKGNGEITWPSRVRIEAKSVEEVILLSAESHQYSWQTSRLGGLFQIYCAFGVKGQLSSASLSFLCMGRDDKAEEEEEGVEEEVEETKKGAEVSSKIILSEMDPFWVRIDYDPTAKISCIHSPVHLHSSLSPYLRLPLDFVPTPRLFVEMMVAWFFPPIYKHYRLPGELLQPTHNHLQRLSSDSFVHYDLGEEMNVFAIRHKHPGK